MTMNRFLRLAGLFVVLLTAAFLVGACADAEDTAPAPTPAPTPAPEPDPEPEEPAEEMHYDIEYEALISSSEVLQQLTGAIPFPEGVTVAPAVAFIAHPVGTSVFELGGMASPGLKQLAETGDSSLLVSEAEEMGFAVYATADAEIQALIQADHPSIDVHYALPCFSFAQMIAPSPDWFIGFSSVCALDEDGHWLEEIELESYAYDAGTAKGDQYMLKMEGDDTEEPITLLDVPPFSPAGTPVSRIHAGGHHEE